MSAAPNDVRRPFLVRTLERTEVGVEWFNGRPYARLGDRRNGRFFTVPVDELADVSAALDEALTQIVDREREARR